MTHVLFRDREEAGKRLAKHLGAYANTDALVLAIPRGGVPVAAAAAHRLRLEWNIIVARKLPIPYNPEAGFGAVASDGSVVRDEAMIHNLRMSDERVAEVIGRVREEVTRRMAVFSRAKPLPALSDRTVMIIDDGLASGYTMLAAIKAARAGGAARVVAASPVSSRSAAALAEQAADECIFDIVSPAVPFAIADFYLQWHDLTDESILGLLKANGVAQEA